MVEAARALAWMAHHDQQDKAGRPYFEHVERVANRVIEMTGLDDAMTVAYLHDVVEDTFLTLNGLLALGFSGVVVDGVESVTRRCGGDDRVPGIPANGPGGLLGGDADELYADLIERAAAHPIGRWVKMADIEDHFREVDGYVLPDSLRTRYENARDVLAEATKMES